MNDIGKFKTTLCNGPLINTDPWLYTFFDVDKIVAESVRGKGRDEASVIAQKVIRKLKQEMELVFTNTSFLDTFNSSIFGELSFEDEGSSRFINLKSGCYDRITVQSHSKKYSLEGIDSAKDFRIEVEGYTDIYSDWFTVSIKIGVRGILIEKSAGVIGKPSEITFMVRVGNQVFAKQTLRDATRCIPEESHAGLTQEF